MNIAIKQNDYLLKKEELKVQIAIALLSALMITIGVIEPLVSVAALFINALYFCFVKSEGIFYQMFFLIPFANVFKYSSSSTSFFTYLSLVLIIVLFIRHRHINIKFFIAFLLFAAYVFAGGIANPKTLIKQLSIPLVVYCFFDFCEIDFKKITMFFSGGLILSSVVALFKENIPNMEQYIVDMTSEVGGTNRFYGLFNDPNYYSLSAIICISLLLLLFAKRKSSFVSISFIAILTVFGSMTGSKSFLALLAISAIYFMFILSQNKQFLTLLIFIIIVSVLVLLVLTSRITLFENTLNRFLVNDDITTGRIEIWSNNIKLLEQSPLHVLIGRGFAFMAAKSSSFYLGAHNTYLDFLVFYGILGTIVFFVALYLAISKKNDKKIQLKFENLFPLFCFLILIALISELVAFEFAYLICITIFTLKYSGNDFEISTDLTKGRNL